MAFDVSEAFIRQHSTDESFRRGQDYAESGAVVSLVQRGNQLQALVEGSEPEPYRVGIHFDGGGITHAACSCPYSWGGWCKHIVAALLACLHRPETVEERPTLEVLLADLDRQQLQTILLTLGERDVSLADVIEGQVALLRAQLGGDSSSAKAAPRRRQTSVDGKAIRRQVHAILHSLDRMRSSEAYWQVGGVVSDVRQVLEQAWGFIRAGEGSAALDVLDAITEEYVDESASLDDSDGEVGAFYDDLGQAWTEAILTADLTPDEREEWAAKLDDWAAEAEQYGIDDAFWSASAAAVQGWDEPVLQGILRGDLTSLPVRDLDDNSLVPDLTAARLNVLERQGRFEEFLRLAQVSGQNQRYALMLLQLGRASEAIEVALHDFGTAAEAFALAQALRERGELDQAVRVAEHGLTLEGPKAQLAGWLCDLAMGMGQRDRALAAAVVVFREEPNLPAYLRVQELANERWPEYREDLLDRLRKSKSWFPRGPVDVFLHEHLIDDAIAAVEGTGAREIIEQVVQAAGESRPEWVIQISRRQAEPTMSQGKAQYYDDAARWLGHARDAYLALGRTDEWRTYLHGLIAEHARKYKLRPLLEALDH